MYLKNLTILGFKSFADKTSLDFPPGITAIVGPNGCGKSNVADSIRWVLGEQSAKALRGGEMADIIFNGTETRRPLSMAEVSLTIGDVDQEQLRAANLELLFNEVTVTRRIYRDGTNEYFLNKTLCRLKDIQQLFLGTGVGRTSYSIMAQGHITQILSSRPEDRRMIFEEAAGITRFKAQKKEALRKLDQTEINLGKLNETVREIKRQIGSLQRQAGKARRYKALAEDLRFLETHYNRYIFDRVTEELNERVESSKKLDEAIEQSNLDIQSLEGQISQSRGHLAELEQAAAEQQKQSLETHSQIDALQKKVEFNQERIQESSNRITAATEEIQKSTEKKLTLQQDLHQVVQTIEVTQQEVEASRQVLRERSEALQSVEAALIAKQTALRNVQNQLFSITQKLSRTRNEINSLDIQKQGNIVRLEKLNNEIAQNKDEIRKLEQKIQEFNQTAESDKQITDEKRAQLQKLQSELNSFQVENSKLGNKQDDLYRQIATRKSRLNVLEQLQSSREGFDAGAMSILKNGTKGVLGALVDRIRIPSKYVNPVEALLGTRLQLVLAEKPNTVRSILDQLKSTKKGMASIAPLDWELTAAEENETVQPPLPAEGETAPVRVLDIVQAEESILTLLRRLIGRAWIVPDLTAATRFWQQHPGQWEFVTGGCEILTRDGIFVGGSRKEVPVSSSILGRKNEIADLKTDIQKVEAEIEEVRRQRETIAAGQKKSQEDLLRLQSEIRSHEMAVATRLGEFRVLENSLRGMKQREETLKQEMTRLTAQDAESTAHRQLLSDQIVEIEQKEKETADNISEINSSVDQLRQERDTAHNALTEVKIALASKEQFCNTHRLQKNSLENQITEQERLITARTKEIAQIQEKVGICHAEIEESKLKIEFLTNEYEQMNQRIADLSQQKKTVSAEIEEREARLKELRGQLNRSQEQHEALNVQIAQRQMTLQNTTSRMQEKYQLDILTVIQEPFRVEETEEGVRIFRKDYTPRKETESAPGENAPETEPVPPEPVETGEFPPVDWDVVASFVRKLQERIDQLGPVNL
ncbi:MAG: chromosome segregation protein SMC, partial [Verrucomicrobia bacterium]|nr:chromosome segregation protein SMC [Verrucomicrobiota bacterium]